jgi:hypothetical protein
MPLPQANDQITEATPSWASFHAGLRSLTPIPTQLEAERAKCTENTAHIARSTERCRAPRSEPNPAIADTSPIRCRPLAVMTSLSRTAQVRPDLVSSDGSTMPSAQGYS